MIGPNTVSSSAILADCAGSASEIYQFTQEAQCVHKGASWINKPHHLGFFLRGVCKLRIKLPKSIFLRVPIQTNGPECEYDALIVSRNSQYCLMIHIVNL